jgi:hypothetical protein
MSDLGKTFEEILSENLAGFGWTIPASQIPDDTTCKAMFQRIFDWYNGLDEVSRIVVDEVNLAPGLKRAGFFNGWDEMAVIFDGPIWGTNTANVQNYVTCFHNAFDRQFVATDETGTRETESESETN